MIILEYLNINNQNNILKNINTYSKDQIKIYLNTYAGSLKIFLEKIKKSIFFFKLVHLSIIKKIKIKKSLGIWRGILFR